MTKLNKKTRRGLALVRSILVDALDDTKPPASTTVAKWPKYMQSEFNQAMAWLEENERNTDAPAPVAPGAGHLKYAAHKAAMVDGPAPDHL